MGTYYDLDMASYFEKRRNSGEEKRKAESKRNKFESENRNSGNYIVRLEKFVDSERKDKHGNKHQDYYESKGKF